MRASDDGWTTARTKRAPLAHMFGTLANAHGDRAGSNAGGARTARVQAGPLSKTQSSSRPLRPSQAAA
eukprot:2756345-Alexandrium_andersonii.AAC.1